MSPVLIITDQLTPHPILERIATKWDVLGHLSKGGKPDHAEALEEVSQDWAAFVADVQRRGIIEPIKFITLKGKPVIVDGRHRWKAALEAQISKVPCIEVSLDQALSIMESTMIGRQHMTKGQRAYAAVVLHPEVATETNDGKGGRPAKNPALSAGLSTMPDLAAKFGVSLRLIEQACQLYRELDGSKTLRSKHEWRVFAGYGLGAIIAGIAGGDATEGKARPKQPKNIVQPIRSLQSFWRHYDQQAPEERDIALEHGQKALSEGDPEFLDFLEELVRGAITLKSQSSNDDGD